MFVKNFSFTYLSCGIRTITPRGKLIPSLLRLGLGFRSRLGLVLGFGGNQTISPEKNDLWLGLGFGLGLLLGLGDNFPRGAIVLEPSHGDISKTKSCLKGMLRPIFCTDINTHSDRK